MSHTEKHCKNYKSFLEIMFFLSVLSDGKVSMVVFVRKLEVVHKQVGGYLILYDLQPHCVRKLEII